MRSLSSHHQQRRLACVVLLLTATAGAAVGAVPHRQPAAQSPAPPAPRQQQLIKPNLSLVEWLRRLLNLNPPLAVGGSRSSGALQVCLISPAITTTVPGADGQPIPAAITPVTTPTLLATGELNELRLERNGVVIWQQRASSSAPITGALAWPIAPLQPGESLQLRIRPRGASGADFAMITLSAAPAVDLQRNKTLIDALGRSTNRWRQAIEQAAATNPPLAIALLTSPQAPAEIRAAAAALDC